MDDHMKVVAKRHSNKSEKEFKKLLKHRYWNDSEIERMWSYVQRRKNNR